MLQYNEKIANEFVMSSEAIYWPLNIGNNMGYADILPLLVKSS
jgi:hypothetical protein